jgi:hypothetical protein
MMSRLLSVLFLCGCLSAPSTPSTVPVAAEPAAAPASTAFDTALAEVDEQIAWNLQRDEQLGGSWPTLDAAAGL